MSPEQRREAMGSDYPCPAPRRRKTVFPYLALKVDLLAQMNEFLCPLHGLHAGVAFLHQLGVQWEIIWAPTRGMGGPQEPTALAPELTSLSALKALVAMSSSWEPGAVRFKMFWWERKRCFLECCSH